MYLASQRINRRTHYYLRESYEADGVLKSRDLFYLGTDPRDYLVYPDDGCAYYVHEDLCDKISALGVEPDNEELERVFFPFLDPETQRVIEAFSHQGRTQKDQKSLRDSVARCEAAGFHMFDKRRMHYLRFVEMDQSRIARAPKKIYRELLDKSRDEIEQYFMAAEQVLRPKEKKAYPYVIFDVASHFPGVLARRFPQTLAQEEVDACFLEEVCRLNGDASFWGDMLTGIGDLNDYLVRYVCWFFDSDFGESRYVEELIWEWMARRRTFRPPAPKNRMKESDALAVMGMTRESFAGVTVKQLTRQYRLMARRRHPDKGGDHDGFIKLNQAFEKLLALLKTGNRTGRYTTRRG